MRPNRSKAFKILDELVAMAPQDQGLKLRAEQIRDRLMLPMAVVLDKVPGRFVVHKARAAGVSRQSYYAWMHGISRPSERQAKQLAKLTGYSVEEIRGAASGAFSPALTTTPAPRPPRRRQSDRDNLAS